MLKMRVHTAEASQAPPSRSIFLNVRDDNRLMVANHDMGYPASAVDQEADLTVDLIRELGDGLAKFWRNDKSRWGSATIEIV